MLRYIGIGLITAVGLQISNAITRLRKGPPPNILGEKARNATPAQVEAAVRQFAIQQLSTPSGSSSKVEVRNGKVYSPSGRFTLSMPAGWRVSSRGSSEVDCTIENDRNCALEVMAATVNGDFGLVLTEIGNEVKKEFRRFEEIDRNEVRFGVWTGVQSRNLVVVDSGVKLDYRIALLRAGNFDCQVVTILSHNGEHTEANLSDVAAILGSLAPVR